jgi:hypothetical protein
MTPNQVNYCIFTAEGKYFTEFYDKLIDESDTSKFYRIFNNKTILEIHSGKIVTTSSKINVKSIQPPIVKTKSLFITNTKIGTFDMETYVKYDKSYVYSLGFYTKETSEEDLKMFYIDETRSSQDLIIKCINAMLTHKYNGYTFYCHNFAKFDLVFLLPALVKYNDTVENKDKFKIEIISKDNLILKLNISKKLPNKKTAYKISFLDSYQLLSNSLDKLGKTYQVEITKGYFPYEFVREDTPSKINTQIPKTMNIKILSYIISHSS